MNYQQRLAQELDRGRVDSAVEMIAGYNPRRDPREDYASRRFVKVREPDPENPLRIRERKVYRRD